MQSKSDKEGEGRLLKALSWRNVKFELKDFDLI
jgi:hypothetical protein